MARIAALIITAALVATPVVAQQNISVIGASQAKRCMDAAFAGYAGRGAVEVCTAALTTEALRPDQRSGTLVNRGVLQMRRRDHQAAEADFQAALAIQPRSGDALFNRGTARLAQGRVQEGLADLDRSLKLGLREPEKAYYNRGIAREQLADTKGAFLDYTQAARLKPEWELPRRELARFSVARR